MQEKLEKAIVYMTTLPPRIRIMKLGWLIFCQNFSILKFSSIFMSR